MAGVSGSIALNIDLTDAAALDLASPKARVSISKALTLLAGTDATNKANLLFSDRRQLAASANEDIDLAGVLTNAFGATITAAEIVAIFISAASGNTNNVNLSRPSSSGFVGPFLAASDGLGIKPGEWQLLVSQSGWAVGAGATDLLNIANSAGSTSVTYDVVIVGRTVAA